MCKTNKIKTAKEDLYEQLIELVKSIGNDISACRERSEKMKRQFKGEVQRQVKKVKEDTDLLSKEVNDPSLLAWTPNIEDTQAKFVPLQEKCDSLKESAQQCLNIQGALEVDPSRFDFVDEIASEIDLRADLWGSLQQFKAFAAELRTAKFASLSTQAIENATEFFGKIVLRCENRGHKDATAVQELRREVMQYKGMIPVIEALCNKKLKPYHWAEIRQTLGTDLPLEEREFTLETLLGLGAAKFSDLIHNISVTASQECWLKEQLKQIKAKWERRGFVFKQYAKELQRDQVTIIAESNLLFNDLDETLTTINTILGSSYGKRLADNAVLAKQQYDTLWQVVDEWLHCQRNWLYLDSIFSSLDIRAHLKKETSDFELVDKQWRHIMRSVTTPSKNVLISYATAEQFEKLSKLNRSMEKIKKELHHYLDTKRREFPRFYFLSDGELLPVMSRSSSIAAIESILPKCFEGIASLEFGPGNPPSEIIGFCSGEGEKIQVKTIRIYSEENVVLWLRAVELQMVDMMKRLIKAGYNEYFQGESDRKAWVLAHCSQVVACVTQLIWTESCEYAIKEFTEDTEALSQVWQQSAQQMAQLVDTIHHDISPLKRNIVISVITKDLHWRDVVERLVNNDVSDIHDFFWQSQLRYYLEDGQDIEEVKVRQVNSEIAYGYEYAGGSSQLVITPLTERCQLTITSALQMHLGTSLAGPAGTGKTETVKDLARAVAVQCVVFNCSEQIEIKIIVRLLSGLALQGAWTCLDEFNRIDTEVLSVIAQQLLNIHDSLQAKRPTVLLNDMEIKLNGSIGVLTTMNPDFANRNELPDNLKSLFRPVSMMSPDSVQIAEVLLFAQGFKEGRILARKLMRLYKFASEQLSQQDHYDFGMRSIKSVLVIAGGGLKQRQMTTATYSEAEILLNAVQCASVSKLLQSDLELFISLVQDLFPEVVFPAKEHGSLDDELEKHAKISGLRPGNQFFAKVQQLHENLAVRVGVMLIGQPGVGKSTCYCTLQEVINTLSKAKDTGESASPYYLPVESHVIFPKSLTLGELYGEEIRDTKEWRYGIASKIIKKAESHGQRKLPGLQDLSPKSSENPAASLSQKPKKTTWLVFDGPIESQWVENLNSVLDDSHILCLANAERIKLSENTRLLFEVQDLGAANPATVSRCGMVYISSTDIGWKAYLESWTGKVVQKVEVFQSCEDLKGMLLYMLEDSIEKTLTALEMIKKEQMLPTTATQMLTSFTISMEYWAQKIAFVDPLDLKKKKLVAYFAFALAWSFGGTLSRSGKQELDSVIRPMFPKLSAPYSGTLFDYRIETVESSNQIRWVPWKEQVPRFDSSSTDHGHSLFVPTADSAKFSYILQTSLEMLRPVLFLGEKGTGKSAMIQHFLSAKAAEEEKARFRDEAGRIQVIPLVFSATTSSKETQAGIEAKLESKSGKKVLAPMGQRKAVIFVDDLNMPQKEQCGAQPALELLRELVAFKGFYGKTKLRWTKVVDTTMLCAATAQKDGIHQRFTHLFNVYWLSQQNSDTLRHIFETILTGFLYSSPFTDPVRKLGTTVVSAVIELYGNICGTLKPVPSKFFYTFDLRDVSRLFQALLMTSPRSIVGAESFVRLWVHECTRVFGDRLCSVEDKQWLHANIAALVNNKFRYDWTVEDLFNRKRILFTDLHHYRTVQPPAQRIYEEVGELGVLAKVLDEALVEYNSKNLNNKMNLVFFDDAIYYIVTIARSLRQKRGHCLLIGMSGCGKESYTSLAAYIMDSSLFKVRGSKSYRKENFKEDLKAVMRSTGVEGKSFTFMLSEYQMSNEEFLEDINSILNTGEVNNLYRSEETEVIFKDITPTLLSMKRAETRENKRSLFVERVRDNFHVVLSTSPVGDKLRLNCRKYPSLLNSSSVIFFYPWPEHAYESVCSKLISELDSLDKTAQKRLSRMFPRVHISFGKATVAYEEETRKKFYVTPKIYIDAIKYFMGAYNDSQAKFRSSVERLSKGLKNFQAANRMVNQLQETLTRLQPVIEANDVKANKALQQKELESQKVFEEEKKIETEKSLLCQQKAIIELSQAEAKKELSKIQPLLEEARQGLETINPKDIAKIKSYMKPPKTVMTVMEAVTILLSNEQKELNLSWEGAKELLNEKGFFRRLRELDFSKITPNTIQILHEYTIDFDPKEIALSDTASVSMAKWCIAMEKCYVAYQKVAPLEEKVRRIQSEYVSKQAEVALMEEALDIVKDRLRELDTECRKLVEEARIIVEQKEKTAYQLSNAELLAKLLRDEGQRWTSIVEKLKEGEKDVLGNTFLLAAAVSYMGPFTAKYRELLLTGWKELCKSSGLLFSPEYSLIGWLGNPLELKMWNLKGLPEDHVSMENGLLCMKANRWPLMIDPEGQANRWIKRVERENELCTVKMSVSSEGLEHIKSIVRAIQLGRPLLLEDVSSELDTNLYNVLGKQTFKSDVEERIYVGDKDVPYNPGFKLYLTTKEANPHFMPEVCNMVNIVNFAVTFDALEEQLLVEVLLKERPEMEAERTKRIVEISSYQKRLRDIEEDILERLTSATEDTILMNIDLIQSLERTKKSSQDIERKIKDAQQIESQIDTIREQYRAVASRGAILYFVLVDMARVNYMYQFSFSFLKQLFISAVGTIQETTAVALEEKRAKMIGAVTELAYTRICRGLFDEHKLLFAFLVATNIGLQAGHFSRVQLDLFLHNPASIGTVKVIAGRPKEGVSEEAWMLACAVEDKVANFAGITKSLMKETGKWADYLKSADPYGDRNVLPLPKLNPLERLILAKMLRPEKLRLSCTRFVTERLGPFYTDYRSSRLEDVFTESGSSSPVIFVLSPGADPTEQLKTMAQTVGKTELRTVSLGKEQEAKAERELQEAKRTGKWLLLQNCHLTRSFMPKLESLVSSLESDSLHPQFRLILTSMSVDHFPSSVLQAGVKHVTEAPAGIKAQLYNAYSGITDPGLAKFSGDAKRKNETWRSLLFGLSIFHAVVQERGKFGSLGWNVAYKFNGSDLEMSKSTLESFLGGKHETIPWDALSFFAGNINYGGRVTDEHDRLLLLCTFKKLVNPRMLQEGCSLGKPTEKFTTVKEYLDYILALPEDDDPSIFGMHENADLAYQTRLSRNFLGCLESVQQNGRSNQCMGQENDVQVQELIQRFLAVFPASITLSVSYLYHDLE